jgi:hypothetical protein
VFVIPLEAKSHNSNMVGGVTIARNSQEFLSLCRQRHGLLPDRPFDLAKGVPMQKKTCLAAPPLATASALQLAEASQTHQCLDAVLAIAKRSQFPPSITALQPSNPV